MRRCCSLLVVVSLAGASLAAPGIAGAAVAQDRPAARHPAAPHPAPEQIARAKARATGRAVEIVSDRTATSTVYAEPSGTLRAIITAVPTRVERGARWIPASTVLSRAAGGAIRPAAISQPLVLSGGGTARPLVRLGRGAKRLDLRWPGRLPVPLISGSTATYRQVLPGVDLEVTARYAGFTELLVVHSRSAASRLLAAPPRFLLTSPGLKVRAGRFGGLVAVDAASQVVFTAPAASMWDSSPPNPRDGSQRTATAAMTLRGRAVFVHPSRAMLTSPATRYPVMIDPSFTAGLLNWVDPLQLHPSEQTWDGENIGTDSNGVIEVGFDPTYHTIARALFQMNTASVNGKHILGATFRITEGWANNCTPTEVDLWETSGISSATTYANQPSWTKELAAVSTAHRTDSSGGCAKGPVAFNATVGVQDAAANGWPNLTLGLRGADEAHITSWKRFYPDATLQVDYNSIPTVGAMSTNPPLTPQCVGGGSQPAANDPYMNSPTPTLIAYADDADTAETQEQGNFAWQSWNGSAWVAAGTGVDPIGRAANTQTSVTLPSGSLTDGTTYRWQVRIADPLQPPYSGTDFSAWSPWCEFIADFSPPPAPQVSGTVYTSGCTPSCGGVGTTGTFTLSANGGTDVTKYFYGFSDPPSIPLTPPTGGGPVSFSWTPPSGGPFTLFVESQDPGGNISAETRYSFTVGAPAPALGSWRLADTSDDTGAHPLTLVGGAALGVPALKVQNTALGLTSDGQYATTSGPVLNTAQSFSVSAWVKLTDNSAYHVAVSQVGASSSGFFLEYDHANNRWAFAGVTADVSNPTSNYFMDSLAAPTLGAWTLLTGTFDAATSTASLYVNGVLQRSQVAAGPSWNATGNLLIGADKWNGGVGTSWIGSLSNVAVWQRVLQPSEISALADPTGDPVGVWHFNETGQTIAFDSSPGGYANDLSLLGNAQIPPSGAGHDGTGLLLLDGQSWAETDGIDNGGFSQVLHTDQSFTVSAWVRLDGSSLPAGSEYAISQAGQTASAFSLGYVASPTPHWDFMMAQADNGSPVFDNAASSVTLTTAVLGTWHLLTGTFNATTNTMSLSVDGSVVATTTRTTAPWDSPGPLLVGGGHYGGVVTGEWTGAIDEVRAYQGVFNGPVGSWHFDGCTGTPVTCPDQGSGNHPLTLGTGVTWTPGSYTASGLTFTGAGTASTNGATVVDTTGEVTASAWVNLAAVPTSDAIVVAEAGAKQDFFELAYSASRGQWCATVYSADSGTATASSACAGSVQTGAWTQLAGVFDPVSQTVTLYLNGSAAATATDNASWRASGGLLVGGGLRNGATAGLLTGKVDDVQILSGTVADPSTLQ